MRIEDLLVENHQIAKRNGFHDPLNLEVASKMTGLLLIYSEVLEVLEPEANVPEELADVILRCSDYLQRWGDASDMHENVAELVDCAGTPAPWIGPKIGDLKYFRDRCDCYVTKAIRSIRSGRYEAGSVEMIGWAAASTLFAQGHDVAGEIENKVAINRTRGHMHGGKRA